MASIVSQLTRLIQTDKKRYDSEAEVEIDDHHLASILTRKEKTKNLAVWVHKKEGSKKGVPHQKMNS